jgi:hypothetical protein
VHVELQRVEQANKEALALCAGEARGHLHTGRFDAPEICFAFFGQDPVVDPALVHLDDLVNIRHVALP